MVGDDDLVPRLQSQAPEHGVNPLSGVADEDHAIDVRVHELRQRPTSIVPQADVFPLEETHRVLLHQGPNPPLLVHNRGGSGSKGAMVQEDGVGVERPVLGQVALARAIHAGISGPHSTG